MDFFIILIDLVVIALGIVDVRFGFICRREQHQNKMNGQDFDPHRWLTTSGFYFRGFRRQRKAQSTAHQLHINCTKINRGFSLPCIRKRKPKLWLFGTCVER